MAAKTRKVKTRPLDVAELLESKADIAGFLEVAFESGNMGHIARAIGAAGRARGESGVILRRTPGRRDSVRARRNKKVVAGRIPET